jgi:hypothetical protein
MRVSFDEMKAIFCEFYWILDYRSIGRSCLQDCMQKPALMACIHME